MTPARRHEVRVFRGTTEVTRWYAYLSPVSETRLRALLESAVESYQEPDEVDLSEWSLEVREANGYKSRLARLTVTDDGASKVER